MNIDTSFAARKAWADRFFPAVERAMFPFRLSPASTALDVSCVADAWLTVEGLSARMLWRIRSAAGARRYGRQVILLREHEIEVLRRSWIRPDLLFFGIAAGETSELSTFYLVDAHRFARWVDQEGITNSTGEQRGPAWQWCSHGLSKFLAIDLGQIDPLVAAAMVYSDLEALRSQHEICKQLRRRTPCRARVTERHQQLDLPLRGGG